MAKNISQCDSIENMPNSEHHPANSTLINRVRIRNFKSIASCDVPLGPLRFLVGLNGSGKSNFIDAIHFVVEALNTTLDHALRRRGGIQAVRRVSRGHPTHFSIQLDFNIGPEKTGTYAFRVGAKKDGRFEIQREKCVFCPGAAQGRHYYEVNDGKVESSFPSTPAYTADRLYLVAMSGNPHLRPVYDALSAMGFYNFNPGLMRELQPADSGEVLNGDGRNLASALGRLSKDSHDTVLEFLSAVVPGIKNVVRKHMAGSDTLEFYQEVKGDERPWKFLANSMSDGTLRALAVLLAILQNSGKSDKFVRLVGIEEPEVALHPAATTIILDALYRACSKRQIIVTSHSPDLLDHQRIADEMILAVEAIEGVTYIAPLSRVGKEALQQQLYTAGELLRLDQLAPDKTMAKADLSERQLGLFSF